MANKNKLRSELLRKSGNFDLSPFNLDGALTKLCVKQLQAVREHLRLVQQFKLNKDSSKKRDEFVDATAASLLRLLQLPSVSSGSVASLLASVQNRMLLLEEADDKMLRLIESSSSAFGVRAKFQARDQSKNAAEIACQLLQANTELGEVQQVRPQPLPQEMCGINPSGTQKACRAFQRQLDKHNASISHGDDKDIKLTTKLTGLRAEEKTLVEQRVKLEAELAALQAKIDAVSGAANSLEKEITQKQSSDKKSKEELELKIADSESLFSCQMEQAQVIPIVQKIENMICQHTTGKVNIQLRKLSVNADAYGGHLEGMLKRMFQYASNEADCIDFLIHRCKKDKVKLAQIKPEYEDLKATGICQDHAQNLLSQIQRLDHQVEQDETVILNIQKEAQAMKTIAVETIASASKHLRRGQSSMPVDLSKQYQMILKHLESAVTNSTDISDDDIVHAPSPVVEAASRISAAPTKTVLLDRRVVIAPRQQRAQRRNKAAPNNTRKQQQQRGQQRANNNNKRKTTTGSSQTQNRRNVPTRASTQQPKRQNNKPAARARNSNAKNNDKQNQRSRGKANANTKSNARANNNAKRNQGSSSKPKTSTKPPQKINQTNNAKRKQRSNSKPSKPPQKINQARKGKPNPPVKVNKAKPVERKKTSTPKSDSSGAAAALPQRVPRRVKK